MDFSNDMATLLTIMGLTMGLFLFSRWRIDGIALCICLLLGLSQLLTPAQLFSGFSSAAVIALVAIMVLSAGLDKAGIMHAIARQLARVNWGQEQILIVVILLSVGILAAFIQNFGACVLFLPMLNRLAMRTGIAPSRLLLPMAFCSILGGTMTLIGSSPLLMLNDLIGLHNQRLLFGQQQLAPFQLFTIAPVGVCLLLTGVIFFLTLGKRLLPSASSIPSRQGGMIAHCQRTYGVGGEIYELVVNKTSPLVNHTLRSLENMLEPGLSIVGVAAGQQYHLPPLRRTELAAGSVLAVMGDAEQVKHMAKDQQCRLRSKLHEFAELCHPIQAGLAEVVIPPSSDLVGQDLKKIHLRRTENIHVLAVHRGKRVRSGKALRKVTLKPGDTLCVYTTWQALHALQDNPNYLIITSEYPRERLLPQKIPLALACFALAVIMIFIPGLSISLALLTGAVGMVLTRVITLDEAYRAISWKTVFLLAGLIPLGIAAEITGTAAWLANHIATMQLHWTSLELQIVLGLLASLLTLLMSNIGATAVLVPLAFHLGLVTGSDPRLLAMTVALCANNSFLIPTHQVNALVSGPGHYQRKDFLRIGGLMSAIFLLVSIPMLHWLI